MYFSHEFWSRFRPEFTWQNAARYAAYSIFVTMGGTLALTYVTSEEAPKQETAQPVLTDTHSPASDYDPGIASEDFPWELPALAMGAFIGGTIAQLRREQQPGDHERTRKFTYADDLLFDEITADLRYNPDTKRFE